MNLSWKEYLSNSAKEADILTNSEFGRKLVLAFKQKNISEGINAIQALHLHHKARALVVKIPDGPILQVDLLNMALTGDLEAGCLALMWCELDDMTSPHHWLNEERRDWLVKQLKEHLGWE